MNQNFRFNNPKQCSNWIILVSFCSSHLAIKNCYNVHFMKIEKIDAKIDFSAKNSKKFVYYNEELVHKFKFQTQLSRKLQRFRTCRKNKKCSIFHDLPNISFFHMVVNYWTGPLIPAVSYMGQENFFIYLNANHPNKIGSKVVSSICIEEIDSKN